VKESSVVMNQSNTSIMDLNKAYDRILASLIKKSLQENIQDNLNNEIVSQSNKIQSNVFEEMMISIIEETILDEECAMEYVKELKRSVGRLLQDHLKQEKLRRQMEIIKKKRITVSSDCRSNYDSAAEEMEPHLDFKSEFEST
jgi:restriction endonuclease Mrr